MLTAVEVMEPALPSDSMGKVGMDWFFPTRGQFDMVNNFIKIDERVEVGVMLEDVDNEPASPGPDGTEPETHEAIQNRPVKGEVSSPLNGGDKGTLDKCDKEEYHSDLEKAGNLGNLDKDKGNHKDERPGGLVSFLPSGHTLILNKEGVVVNSRPPTITSAVWKSKGE